MAQDHNRRQAQLLEPSRKHARNSKAIRHVKNSLAIAALHLSQDLVSHATIRNRADELFFVKVIWKSEINLASHVKRLHLFRRERHVEARKIGLGSGRAPLPGLLTTK